MLKDAECFTRIYLRTGRTDMRLGIDGLLTVIGGQMGLDPTEPGSVFLFCGRKKNRMKALIFEKASRSTCFRTPKKPLYPKPGVSQACGAYRHIISAISSADSCLPFSSHFKKVFKIAPA